MVSYVLLGIVGFIVLSALRNYRSLRKNIAIAKSTGIPYVVTPWFFLNRWMMFTVSIWEPLAKKLPESWTASWLEYVSLEGHWRTLYSHYRELGSDTFLQVSPGKIAFFTADADVVHQITQRRNDFPKPIETYKIVDIYGKNVVSTEGHDWRRHRKITAPPFTEKNNHLVFDETVLQTMDMMDIITSKRSKTAATVINFADYTTHLALAVISKAGFGVDMKWPSVDESGKLLHGHSSSTSQDTINSKGGTHNMTFPESLHILTQKIFWIILMPHRILSRLPLKDTKLAYSSFIEWGDHMKEIIHARKARLDTDDRSGKAGTDLLTTLIRSSRDESINQDKDQKVKGGLSDEEILGNAFVFIMAGHETSANSLYFSLIYLAMYTDTQRRLQKELDEVFGGRPPSEWSYDDDLPKLFSGITGAVLAEELRLIPPVISIPKCTLTDQHIQIDGKTCTVPAKTLIGLVTVAVHRNPRFWPTGPAPQSSDLEYARSNTEDDLGEFRPERWLQNNQSSSHAMPAKMPGQASKTPEDLAVNTAPDTSDAHYKPPHGAYVPFSDGFRSCLGRRFAQVEVMAVLAVIFQNYSVELDVEQWATEKEVAGMSKTQREEVWEKARKEGRRKLRENMGSIITIQMRGGVSVPMRFVKRGHEVFQGR